jgi:hypothetical protein
LQNYVKAIKEKSAEELCYNYKDDWDEIMSAEIPGILKLVEELRNR